MCSRLVESKTTTYFFLLAQVTNTLLCRSGPRQGFFSCLVLGQVQVGLTLYSCFSTVDLENIFLRSQTLFKKVAVKRCFWYTVLVAAKACFYKTAKQFFTSASTPRFYADLDFVPAPTKFGRLLMYASLKWPIT